MRTKRATAVWFLAPLTAFAADLGSVRFVVNEQLSGFLGIDPPSGEHAIVSNTLAFARSALESYAGGSIHINSVFLVPFNNSARRAPLYDQLDRIWELTPVEQRTAALPQ